MSTSPGWKKPSDVMKTRLLKRRKSSLSNHMTTPKVVPQDTPTTGSSQRSGNKRKNPFASVSQEKKACIENVDSKSDSQPQSATQSPVITLFQALDQSHPQEEERRKPEAEERKVLMDAENALQKSHPADRSIRQTQNKAMEKDKPSGKFYPAFPIDWSLKTKVRYISEKPFSWCGPLKSQEESAGVMLHMTQDGGGGIGKEDQLYGDSVEAKSEFQKCCLLWSHPYIPWLKTFPRVVNDTKIGKPSVVFHSEDIQKVLLDDWTKSFTSLFHLLRSGHCPYFYLCSHLCTVLYRGAGVGGRRLINAIVTPTTRGFRESLKEEGVEFEMPLNSQRKTAECDPDENLDIQTDETDKGRAESTTDGTETADSDKTSVTQTESAEIDDVDDDITQTDSGASSWLATLGIDRSKYKSLDPNKVKFQRDSFKIIDNRPESAVYVEGADTHALFNFLLNWRSCVNSTGELAGVPPSLLAPCPFKGATLTSLAAKHGSIRQQLENGAVKEAFSVELSGPILPYTLHNLHELFRKTQGDFISSCSVQETTTPFNVSVGGGGETMERHLAGIHQREEPAERTASIEGIRHTAIPVQINDSNNGRQAIRELHCEKDLYCWL